MAKEDNSRNMNLAKLCLCAVAVGVCFGLLEGALQDALGLDRTSSWVKYFLGGVIGFACGYVFVGVAALVHRGKPRWFVNWITK